MKTIFILIVTLASLYLFLPEKLSGNITNNIMERIEPYLPQHKIENAAEQLLAQVDNKLKHFESSLNEEQKIKISSLENKILALKKVQQEQIASLSAKKEDFKKDVFIEKPVVNKTEAISAVEKTFSVKSEVEELAEQKVLSAKNDKKWQLERLANLQDISQRMNEKSLQALTF